MPIVMSARAAVAAKAVASANPSVEKLKKPFLRVGMSSPGWNHNSAAWRLAPA
jgi:hypothetical protein